MLTSPAIVQIFLIRSAPSDLILQQRRRRFGAMEPSGSAIVSGAIRMASSAGKGFKSLALVPRRSCLP